MVRTRQIFHEDRLQRLNLHLLFSRVVCVMEGELSYSEHFSLSATMSRVVQLKAVLSRLRNNASTIKNGLKPPMEGARTHHSALPTTS